MRLPPGATGFAVLPADGHRRAFTAACHHAARATGGVVLSVTPAGQTPNFHTADLAYGSERAAVLGHATVPLVAFALPRPDDDLELTFVDNAGLAAAIAAVSDFEILTAEQLNTPLSRADLSALDPSERDQIAYWQPTTIGELLFNFWD